MLRHCCRHCVARVERPPASRSNGMIRAYILIEASVGKGNAILQALRRIPEIKRADRVTGPYDVVCVMEVDDLDKLGNLVRDNIHTIDGIIRTMSCVSFSQ